MQNKNASRDLKNKNNNSSNDEKNNKNETKDIQANTNCALKPNTLDTSLDMNVEIFKDIFQDDDTIVYRFFNHPEDTRLKCCIIFVESMVDSKIINDNIIRPIVQYNNPKNLQNIIDDINNYIVLTNFSQKNNDIDQLVKAIIQGNTVLLIEDADEALILSTKGWETRSITEPEAEKSLNGPKEGFVESISVNLTMLRRKIDDPALKFKYLTLGKKTKTKICVSYIEGIAKDEIVQEVFKRISDIDIDSVLGPAYIDELIKDSPLSIFRTVGYTEKPDVAAGKLLEGRIAIFTDGSPVVLTVPFLFVEYFHTDEDYYDSFYFATINRLLRLMGLFITTTLPALYISLMTFHQEMIPTSLLISITASRQGVPFPTIVETILLLASFEILREASTRMSSILGQSLSVLGALVLGQAAVEAKFFSSPIVIIVAISGITGLIVPRLKLVSIVLRLILIFSATSMGYYGTMLAWVAILLYLCSMRSFGVPYLTQMDPLDLKDLSDTAIRAPWWVLENRPKLVVKNRKRQKSNQKPSPSGGNK